MDNAFGVGFFPIFSSTTSKCMWFSKSNFISRHEMMATALHHRITSVLHVFPFLPPSTSSELSVCGQGDARSLSSSSVSLLTPLQICDYAGRTAMSFSETSCHDDLLTLSAAQLGYVVRSQISSYRKLQVEFDILLAILFFFFFYPGFDSI